MEYNNYEREAMLTLLHSKILVDDDIVIVRKAGNERTTIYNFVWKNFQLFNSSGKEIDLETDIFNEK